MTKRTPAILFAVATVLAIALAILNLQNTLLLIGFGLVACVLAVLCVLSYRRVRD